MDLRFVLRLCQNQRRVQELKGTELDKAQDISDVVHVVAAIIWHPTLTRTFLISRRQQGKHLEHYWELPGGKREQGEEARPALVRELKEEVNIDVKLAEPFMQVSHEYTDLSILLDVWQVTEYEGGALGLEGQEICWVSIDDLDLFLFPDADRPVLDAIKSIETA